MILDQRNVILTIPKHLKEIDMAYRLLKDKNELNLLRRNVSRLVNECQKRELLKEEEEAKSIAATNTSKEPTMEELTAAAHRMTLELCTEARNDVARQFDQNAQNFQNSTEGSDPEFVPTQLRLLAAREHYTQLYEVVARSHTQSSQSQQDSDSDPDELLQAQQPQVIPPVPTPALRDISYRLFKDKDELNLLRRKFSRLVNESQKRESLREKAVKLIEEHDRLNEAALQAMTNEDNQLKLALFKDAEQAYKRLSHLFDQNPNEEIDPVLEVHQRSALAQSAHYAQLHEDLARSLTPTKPVQSPPGAQEDLDADLDDLFSQETPSLPTQPSSPLAVGSFYAFNATQKAAESQVISTLGAYVQTMN